MRCKETKHHKLYTINLKTLSNRLYFVEITNDKVAVVTLFTYKFTD